MGGVLLQALGLCFTISTLALAASLALHGALPLAATGTSLPAARPALSGIAFGRWLRARMRLEALRGCFFVGLLVLDGELLWRV